MSEAIEIGDIVSTDDGMKMVVNIFRNMDSKNLCLSCVDTDDNNDLGDVWMTPVTYLRSQVVPVFHPNRYES